jgi:hypothetical protein
MGSLKAKFIHEALDFERGKEPKESMGVGRVRRGKFKERFEEDNREDFKEAFHHLAKNLDQSRWTIGEASTDRYFMISVKRKPKKGTYDEFVIIAPKEADENDKKYLETIGYLYSTSTSWRMTTLWTNDDPYITWVEMAEKLLEIMNSNPKLPKTEFFKRPAEWEDRFNESMNFERGVDPKDSMKLGIRNKRSFKTVKECAKFFIDNIDKLSEGRFNNIEELKDAFKRSAEGGNKEKIIFPQPLKMSKDYLDGFRIPNSSDSKYPPIYTEEWGTVFSNVEAKLAALRDFHLEIQNLIGLRDPDKPLSEAINFERGIDPKASMQLGWRARIIQWFNEPHAFEDFFNGFYDLLPKKIKRFTTDHWLIRHIAKFVGHSGKEEITPEQFADLLEIILSSNVGEETDKIFKFSKYEDIYEYDNQVTEGHLDETIYKWMDEGLLFNPKKFKKELEKFPNDMHDCIQSEEDAEAEEEKTQKRISN